MVFELHDALEARDSKKASTVLAAMYVDQETLGWQPMSNLRERLFCMCSCIGGQAVEVDASIQA
jgi:hypothetical protein